MARKKRQTEFDSYTCHTLNIPDGIFKKAEEAASSKGISISALVTQMVNKGLAADSFFSSKFAAVVELLEELSDFQLEVVALTAQHLLKKTNTESQKESQEGEI